MATRKPSKKDIDHALDLFEKSWGEGYRVRGLSDASYEAIPTGYDDLDAVLTNGAYGLYLGGIMELFGTEGSGKSSVAMRAVGSAQKTGHLCMWIDAEAGFAPDLAKLNGVDLGSLLVPDLSNMKKVSEGSSFLNAAQILEMIYESIMQDIYGLIVLDSVAGLMPERILREDYNPNSAGISELARDMSTGLKKIAPACASKRCSVIFINQIRAVPGEKYRSETTPGGNALKFFASQRLRVSRVGGAAGEVFHEHADGTKELIGHYGRVNIAKNKRAVPVREPVHIPIYYREYFPDDAKKVYDLARSLKVMTIRLGTLTWKENDDIVVQTEGEPFMLDRIRSDKMESRLAKSCVDFAEEEKNTTKKTPVVVPKFAIDLAKKYRPEENKSAKPSKPRTVDNNPSLD